MVVEDEPYMAEAIRDGLRLEAIAADIAGDGDTALELLSVHSYDIAVLDRDIPGPTGDSSGVSLAGGSSLVLFRSSPNKAAAWQLIEFLSRPEQQRRFYQLTGDLPARKEAWQDSSLIGDPYIHAFWEQLQRVAPTPKVPEWELIATKVFDYAEQSIRGGAPPDEVLRRLDRDVNGILEKRRWLLARAGSAR